MKDIIQHWGLVITFLGLLGIEISPIKINPLKWLGKVVGNLLNGDLVAKIDDLANKVNKMEKDADFKNILDIKNNLSNYHVMLQTMGLDENQFRRCFELEEKYNFYKNKYPGEVNGHMDALLESIHTHYKNDDILKSSLQKR
jgi:hypothetical protein